MPRVRRFPWPVLASLAAALVLPWIAMSPAAQASPAPQTAAMSPAHPSADPTARKPKPPKGMPDQRLRQLIEQSFRQYDSIRSCDASPTCAVTFAWTKIQGRGSARHCIAGQNYGLCEKWATAYIARTDLLVTQTKDPDVLGKLSIYMTQYGYWDNGLKRVPFTDGYGAKESWCSASMGCGKDLLVWQDEFKDWFYSFSNIGDCCSSVRLT